MTTSLQDDPPSLALDFRGKRVLVVGGSSGIGNAIAHGFRRAGASVQVWGTRASARDYEDELGSVLDGLDYTQVDASDPNAIRSVPWQGGLDTLVLSQGMVLYGREEFSDVGFRRVLEVNLSSLMTCCTRFFEPLRQSHGNAIIINSTAAFRSTRGNPAYNASKAGALGLTRTLGEAWAPEGVRVNGIAPGMIETKMTRVTTEHPKRRQSMVERIPLGRIGSSQDMVGAALFLASPLAAYVVGQTISVDGGLNLA